MKSILETFILAVSFVFVSWLIITVGMKFEIKINGGDYGFTIGGASVVEKEKITKLRIYNSQAGDGVIVLELDFMEYLGKEKFDSMAENHYKQYSGYSARIIRDVVTGKKIDLLVLSFKRNNYIFKEVIHYDETLYTVI